MARVSTDLNEELREDPVAWMNYSACVGADISEFYPPEDISEDDRDKLVKEVTDRYCAKCPVRTLCYDFAKESNSVGIWGCVLFPYDGTLPSDPEEGTDEQREVDQ